MAWQPVDIPPIPDEIRGDFVAHSVVATLDPLSLFGRNMVRWKHVRDLDVKPPTTIGRRVSGISRRAAEIEGLASALAGKPGDQIVALPYGTIVNTGAPRPSVRNRFNGFARENSRFYLPANRFRNGNAGVKCALHSAQKVWEVYGMTSTQAAPTDLVAATEAFELLARQGYPQAGMNESDGNVAAIWYNPAENSRIALVQLKKFEPNIGSLVKFEKSPEDLTFAFMKDLVDVARDGHRNDYLEPSVDGVFSGL